MKRSVALMACGTLALVSLSGCETSSPPAATAAAASSQCLDVRQIQSIMPQDSRTVDIVTNANEAFELKLDSPCLDLDVQARPQVRTRGTNQICGAGDGDVFYPGSNIPQVCRVMAVRHMSADEAAKLK